MNLLGKLKSSIRRKPSVEVSAGGYAVTVASFNPTSSCYVCGDWGLVGKENPVSVFKN